jgi:metallo-beta-lactamase class B
MSFEFARLSALPAVALLAAACTSPTSADQPPQGAPITELLSQCDGKDGWSDPAPPVRLFANVYNVGTCGIVVLLVMGDDGNVLLDGATEEAAPLVAENIKRLGVSLDSIKWIVTSHPHSDHVGGVAELLRLTGAKLAASKAAQLALENGGGDPADPQLGIGDKFVPVIVSRVLADEETLTLGNLALTLHMTPGHTPGSTSWSWQSCDGKDCRKVAFADSVTAISDDDYRYSANPDYVAAFSASLDRIAMLDCDLLITPHPSASTLFERLAGDAPLTATGACGNYAEWGRQGLEARLERERTQ